MFDWAYDRTQYGRPERDANEALVYQHALGFLQRFIDEAAERELEMRHRLDAQSAIWQIYSNSRRGSKQDSIKLKDEPEAPSPMPSPQTLTNEVYLPASFLDNIETLLIDKKQVIFQGPPGTGKTYVAQALAKHLAGSEELVTIAQFHPSYAYEDFVQGFRPTLRDGQAGFELKDGPLLRAAKRAREEPGRGSLPHH